MTALRQIQPDPNTIPLSLRKLPRWVCWRYETRNGKPTKVPIQPNGRPAKSNDPSTWSEFEACLAAAKRHAGFGIGFMLGGGIVGVDLDHARDPESAALQPWAREIISELNSYTEVSPSGTGVHILCRGELPAGRRRHGHVEMYSEGRFFTITGQRLNDRDLEDRTAELAALHRGMFGSSGDKTTNGYSSRTGGHSAVNIDDQELIRRAHEAEDGGKFARLWAGRWEGDYPSQSEADLALCSLLAFWTGGDAGRIDRLFRKSGLMREKWKRADYREATIARAIAGAGDHYSPHSLRTDGDANQQESNGPAVQAHPPAGCAAESEPRILAADQVEAAAVEPPRFAIEDILTTPGAWCLVGAQKSGKTTLAVQLALSYQAGCHFLDYYRTLESRGALIVLQDDPMGLSTLKELFRRSPIQRNPAKLFVVENPQFTIGPKLTEYLKGAIVERDLGLIVLDSYTVMRPARGSGADIVKSEWHHFRLLDELAKTAGCIILVLHHRSHGRGREDWSDQAAGTYAIGAAVEGLLHISRFRELPSNARERLVRVRGRRIQGTEFVVQFRPETLDYEWVMSGPASQDYPVILEIQRVFGKESFTPTQLHHKAGIPERTAHRLVGFLTAAGVLKRQRYGEYVLAREFLGAGIAADTSPHK